MLGGTSPFQAVFQDFHVVLSCYSLFQLSIKVGHFIVHAQCGKEVLTEDGSSDFKVYTSVCLFLDVTANTSIIS